MTKEFLEQLLANIYKKIDNKVVVVSGISNGDNSSYPEGTLCVVLGSGESSGGNSTTPYMKISLDYFRDGLMNEVATTPEMTETIPEMDPQYSLYYFSPHTQVEILLTESAVESGYVLYCTNEVTGEDITVEEAGYITRTITMPSDNVELTLRMP